jgi:excisionase family DNA binding protein
MKTIPHALRKESSVPLSGRLALSIAECARVAGLSCGKLRSLARSGKLRTYRVGRRILVRPDDLERALFGAE